MRSSRTSRSCAAAASHEMTALVDASGVALELAHPSRRIVLLIPPTTEILDIERPSRVLICSGAD